MSNADTQGGKALVRGRVRAVVWGRVGSQGFPAKDTFDGWDTSVQAKLLKVAVRLASFARVTSPEHFKMLHDDKVGGIFELKCKGHRLLGFFTQPSLAVLVHAFKKKTNKTPPKEVGVLLDRRSAWKERWEK